jgi:hypothetical protein
MDLLSFIRMAALGESLSGSRPPAFGRYEELVITAIMQRSQLCTVVPAPRCERSVFCDSRGHEVAARWT